MNAKFYHSVTKKSIILPPTTRNVERFLAHGTEQRNTLLTFFFHFLYRKKYIYSTLAVPTDQDGRMMNLNYNSEATKIFQENTSVKGIDIVGQAVVVKKGWMNIEIETE